MPEPEPQIRLLTYVPCSLTLAEFRQLEREVADRIFAGIAGVSDRVLSRLIDEHQARALVVAAQLDERGAAEPTP